jgi:outer membrane protein OmpA-like peptidoglycan-associated protein
MNSFRKLVRTSLLILLLAFPTVNTLGQLCTRIPDVYYNINSATLSPSSQGKLDSLIVYLKDNDSVQLQIFSFTDSKGSASYNKSLSEKRNKAVVDYLKFAGIAGSRIKAYAMGENNLLPEKTKNVQVLGAQVNRRTEFRISLKD